MGRYLGLDVGEKRIGVAISDESRLLARPMKVIARASKREDFAKIAELIAEQDVERVVVGLPRTRRGEEGYQAARVRRFVEALAQVVGVPIAFQDEGYTSAEAEERLAAKHGGGHPHARPAAAHGDAPRRVTRKRAKGDVDAAAAAIILQDYLNQRMRDEG